MLLSPCKHVLLFVQAWASCQDTCSLSRNKCSFFVEVSSLSNTSTEPDSGLWQQRFTNSGLWRQRITNSGLWLHPLCPDCGQTISRSESNLSQATHLMSLFQGHTRPTQSKPEKQGLHIAPFHTSLSMHSCGCTNVVRVLRLIVVKLMWMHLCGTSTSFTVPGSGSYRQQLKQKKGHFLLPF